MRAFAQKPKATDQTTSAKSPMPGRAHFGQSREANSILHLQRTIGNQAVQQLLQANAEELEAGSSTTASTHVGHHLSRIPLHAQAPDKIQPPVMINTPGNISEQEADNVADYVMRMPEPQLKQVCACGGGCPKCQNAGQGSRQTLLQTKPARANDSAETVAPPIVNDVLSQTGQSLDASTRAFAERHLGHSFEHVRIHTDGRAAASAEAVEARAYTVGNHIVFGDGEFHPHAQDGRRLLLHELVHTMQMGCGERDNWLARTPQNGCTRQRIGVADPDATMVQQIAQVAHDVDNAVFMLRGRLSHAWYDEGYEHDRVDFFFNCPSDARVQEIIADLERLRAILEPSFPYHCGTRTIHSHTMEAPFAMPYGNVPSGLIVGRSDFADPDFLRWNVLAVGLRLIGIGFQEKVPYLNYVRREAHGTPTCQPVPTPGPVQSGQPPAQRERLAPADLGLSTQSHIYLSLGADGMRLWDWEPPGSSMGVTHHYDWHYDQSAGRVFIVVDGQRVNLLRDGRTEIQR